MNEEIKNEEKLEDLEQGMNEEQVQGGEGEEGQNSEENLAVSAEADASKMLEVEKDKYLRLQAEFMNYKKRVEKEKIDIYKNASAKLITDLLPVLDDFDRAISHANDANAFMEGMKLIVKRFEDCLKKEGLEVIETLNIDFDPTYHHAVLMEETDTVESGKIFEEIQKGYMINGKVLRPAMVKVAK